MKVEDRRLLAVFAHPDDESFCAAGSLKLAADNGVEIHLLCATRGEDGQWHGLPIKHKHLPGLPDQIRSAAIERKLAQVRSKELQQAAKIIGIKKVELLKFVDGCLCNRDVAGLLEIVEQKIKEFKPQVVLSFGPDGVSGHIDHLVLAGVAKLAVAKQLSVQRLYQCIASAALVDKVNSTKTLHLPKPIINGKKVVKYNISKVWESKKQAVMAHQTQKKDWQILLPIWEELPKFEYYQITIARKPPTSQKIPFF